MSLLAPRQNGDFPEWKSASTASGSDAGGRDRVSPTRRGDIAADESAGKDRRAFPQQIDGPADFHGTVAYPNARSQSDPNCIT
jgi:hypothetical protein